AEDGIRDRNVTGVQTCALPICELRKADRGAFLLNNLDQLHGCPHKDFVGNARLFAVQEGRLDHGSDAAAAADKDDANGKIWSGRSEERRVGKEWRWRLAQQRER